MALKGSLHTVDLPEVLTFLAGTGKSGEFHVSGSRGEGRLWFDQGRIAGFEVSRSHEPADAIFELLRIDDGDFDFDGDTGRPDHVPAVGSDDGAIEPALEAAQARMAEWRDIVAVVPSLEHRLALRADEPSDTVVLEPAQWMMVVAVGTGRTVAEVIDARGMQEFDGCKAVRSLVDASLVEVLEPVAEAPVAEEPIIDEPVVEEPVAWHSEYQPSPADDENVAVPETVPYSFEPDTHTEAQSDDDHYAALRAAVVEIGDDLVPAEDYATYAEPAHPVYELSADPQLDSRAALQALLSEVSEDGATGSDYESHPDAHGAVDGLADRGPWTDHELSAMDVSEHGAWDSSPEDTSNIVPFAPVHSTDEQGYDPTEAVDDDSSETEEETPAEEPINRGLLLKFLSSVRN